MGGFGKGSDRSTNTVQNTAQTYMANPAISGIGNQAIGQAQSAASQPFQMPQAPVADFNADQLAAFQQYRGLPGIPAPYLAQANQAYGNAATPIDSNYVNQIYDPMASRITSNLKDVFGHQNVGTQGNLVQQAGGVDADRIAVGMGEAEKAQGSIANNAYLGAYQQALQMAQQQKQLQLGAGSGFTNLAAGATQDNLAATNAYLHSGMLQQNQAQQQLNAPYQQRLAQIAFPYQNAQFLAGITGGLAPAFGGTTYGNQNGATTPPQPSALSQVLGVGTAGAGLYGAFGGFNGSGKGTQSGASYGGYGSGSNGWGSMGGVQYPAFAEGGATDDENNPHVPGITSNEGLSPIPYLPLHGGAGHSSPLTGGVTFQQPQQEKPQDSGGGLGDVLKAATSIAPFFALKDGGVAGYEAGGDPYPMMAPEAVNPWILNPSGRRDTSHDNDPPVIMGESPSVKQWRQATGAAPAATAYPGTALADRFGAMAPAAAAAPTAAEFDNPSRVANGAVPLPIPYPGPGRLNAAEAAGAYRQPSPTAKGTDDEDVKINIPANRESSPREIMRQMMPQANQPYPDALERNPGQVATRSPWMALVNAGATMAATPGPLGVSLGKGMLAGTKSLDDQRKELQTEQGINQKAQALYQTAKAELDKYTKMEPYDRAKLQLENKELDQTKVPGAVKPITELEIDRLVRRMESDYKYGTTPLDQKRALAIRWLQEQRARQGIGTTALPAVPAGPPQSSAPAKTVIQNGHSYTLQPDGSYK